MNDREKDQMRDLNKWGWSLLRLGAGVILGIWLGKSVGADQAYKSGEALLAVGAFILICRGSLMKVEAS